MLRFVESYETYSLYERADGTEVYLAPGFPRVELVDYSPEWLAEAWASSPLTSPAFLDWARTRVLWPSDLDNVRCCEWCDNPTEENDGAATVDDFACNHCIDRYYYGCADCGRYTEEPHSTGHDESVCQSCLDNNYSWCHDCDNYYHDDYSDEHQHDGGGCCEPQATRFAIRNDGAGMLRNDEQVTVTLPAGTIDAEGIKAIRRYLAEQQDLYSAAYVALDIDRRWQTKEGNFTKRLSRAVYKYDGTKISPEVLSQVGCIARDHSKPVDFTVSVTRELNMSAADFYHADSCWWGSYSEGRCALKSNGGFGLRSFNGDNEVAGRAWVMPLASPGIGRELRPTFNTETPAAFVVFNGYGNLEGYAAARIMAHMAGWTYRKITFACGPMYINSDVGYLIAPEEIAERYTDGSLHLVADQHSNLLYTETYARETASV